jgi:hypothetical protein
VDVDLEDDPAPLQREGDDRLVDRGGRVVHQDLDRAAEQPLRLGDDALSIHVVGEIGDENAHVRAVPLQPGLGLHERSGQVVVAIQRPSRQDDVGALGRQALGDGGADPAAGARDERPAAREAIARARGHQPFHRTCEADRSAGWNAVPSV